MTLGMIQQTDLGDAPNGAAESGIVAGDDRAVDQIVCELGCLGEVMFLVRGGFVHKT